MKITRLLVSIMVIISLQACSSWIYRIDVPQGNYLAQKDVDRLRIDMTKEQVVYVLGHPVVNDPFNPNKWYYVYHMKRGMSDDDFEKELILEFENNRLASMSGDFDKPEDFDTPLE